MAKLDQPSTGSKKHDVRKSGAVWTNECSVLAHNLNLLRHRHFLQVLESSHASTGVLDTRTQPTVLELPRTRRGPRHDKDTLVVGGRWHIPCDVRRDHHRQSIATQVTL